MIHKKILAFLLFTLVLSPLYAGPGPGGGRPQSAWEAIERHEQGEIITEVSLFSGDIPEEFWDIETIESMSIGHFSIEELPEGITKLKNLRSITLYGAPKNFRLTDVIARIPKLKHLGLAEMGIDKFPMIICQFKNLESLSLRSFKIGKLPECIGQLVNLKKLSLNKNEITELPESIGQLMNLKELDLSKNNLTMLPNSIVNLINTAIDLSSTPINNFIHFGNRHDEVRAKYYKEFIPKYVQGNPKIIPSIYTVTATSGLSVRNKPKLKAKKIGSMPYGLKIAVYEKSSKTETIDGITAPWMRIKAVANGQYMEGWAWGGYLKVYKYEEDYQLRFQEMVNEAIDKAMDETSNLTLDTKQIQLFIKNGADIDTPVNDGQPPGWTLLNIVAKYGNIQDFRFLLANGANFQIKVADVASAASFVMRRKDIGPESKKVFFSALQDYGYDLKSEGKDLVGDVIYYFLECGEDFEEQSFDSEELDFLKEQLGIKSVSEIFSDEEIQTLYHNIQENQCQEY